jgi:hypothetical protein
MRVRANLEMPAKVADGKSRSLGEYCRFDSDPKIYERFDSSRNL